MGRKQNKRSLCHCGSGEAFALCCQPYLIGDALPTIAEQLMRSRYSAYVIGNEAYILKTWHQSTRPEHLDLQSNHTAWFRLKVVDEVAGRINDSEGLVEFIAFYKINGKAHMMHEKSRFIKEGNRWFYLNSVSGCSDHKHLQNGIRLRVPDER